MDNGKRMVEDFHRRIGAPVSKSPMLLSCNRSLTQSLANELAEVASRTQSAADGDAALSRAAMALEELAEWLDAHASGDLIAAADAWADRAYVLLGDAVAAGLPADALFREVHRSNMTKERESAGTAKAVKGTSYQPPDIRGVIENAEYSRR